MLDILLTAFGGLKNKTYAAAADDYRQRLRPYARLQETELEPEPFRAATKLAAQKREAERLDKFLVKYPDASVFLLDEAGESLDSPAFAKRLEAVGTKKIILVIGAALGFSPELKKRYPRLSLSRLTMPHELARVVLLEQLYRAVTILNGKQYHY
jgi:23S rRNA (pseudouridine1915-N3)-methyltransferase